MQAAEAAVARDADGAALKKRAGSDDRRLVAQHQAGLARA